MTGYVSPAVFECAACGATGLGGRPALDAHITDRHAIPAAGVAPDGVDPKALRAWALTHGWPTLGDRGRLPQDAITAYVRRSLMPRLVAYAKHYGPTP